MSLSDRRRFLVLLAALPLAACGFSPAYGPGGSAGALRDAVLADAPSDRDGFDYVAALEDRLGRPDTPRFTLEYTIAVTDTRAGFTPADVATRHQLSGTVDFALTDSSTGEQVISDQVHGMAGYSATSTQLATLTASEDARRRLMRMLADQTVTRLLAVSGTLPR